MKTAGSARSGEFRQVATLLAALQAMGTERVFDDVLAVVLDAAIETTGAERGFIMLADKRGTLRVAWRAARAAVSSRRPRILRTMRRKIPEQVFATGQLQVVADLLEGDLPETHTQDRGVRHPTRVVFAAEN